MKLAALILSLFSFAAYAEEHKAHVHGAAQFEIAFEVNHISVDIDSPADSFVGFEHAPKSAKDKKHAAEIVALLQDSANLFQFNSEAACKQTAADIAGAALGRENEKEKAEHTAEANGHDHSDLDLHYSFTCEKPMNLKKVEFTGFKKFAKLQKIDASFISKSSQKKATLTAKNTSLEF